jgi:PAS domain S-box-containing protein
MKTKKIEERAKKIKPGRKDEKAQSKKKRPGKVLGAAAEKDSDITERKKAESQREAALEALVKSENRFRSIFESSRDAIMTLEPPYWKFTSGNPAALKMFMAKDEADFASHEPWTMSSERQPDGRASIEKAKEMIEIAMRDGSNFFEWTHKRLNGEEFPATVLLTRMILAEKTILQATVRDITERKRAESQREAALEALQTSHDELECRVQERTAELAQANEMLKADIIESKRAELQKKEALEALRRSEENFRRSLEDSPLGVRVVTAKGETIYVNKVFLEIYGYANVEELNKIPLKERYTSQSYIEFQLRKKSRDQGDFGPSEYEINIVRKNKGIRHLQVLRKEVLWNGTRQFQVIYQDITERKRAESQREAALAALRESEEKYRTLFTSSSDAIMLIEPLSGKFISGNQTTMEMFGLKNDDDFSSFGPWDFSPERQPDGRASAEKAKEMNEIAMRDGSNFFEWTHKRLNGEEFSANVRLTRMVLDKKTILQATVRDITERKHAEEEIKMLATALKRINECVSITDVENTILFVNEAFLKTYGYSEQELIGQNIKIVRPPNSPQKVFEEVLPGTLSGGWTGELVNRRKDGSEFPIFLSTTIIEKKDGKPNCLIGIAIDITERKRAEDALRESEENFRHSLDDSPLGARIVTAEDETIYANKVILDIYGYANVEELNKISLKDRYTPQSYAEFHMRKKDRERGDFGPSEYEINIVRKNGEIRHLLVLRKEVLWNGTKQFQVIYQDITERKQAESQREDALAALRESEEKFRKIFEDHAAVKLLIEPESGAIIDANKAAEQYYGWTRAELKRMHIQQLNILPAEQVKIEMEKVQQQKCVHFEFRHRRADGSIRDVEVFSSKIEMAGKDILHSIIHDITERKRAEKALRESEERYRQLVDNTDTGFVVIDAAGIVLEANDSYIRLVGTKNMNEIIGHSVIEWTSPDERENNSSAVAKCAEQGYIQDFETSYIRKDGEKINILITATMQENAGEKRLVSLCRDITERKRAEKEIRASLAEKEILLKEVHHRVKNNLMIIIGLIKMQEAKADNKMFNPLLQELEGRIRSMALVHESLHKSEDLAHVDLQNYIETLSAQIHAQFGADRDIRFLVQAAGVNVNLDIAVPCGLILNELITNAFKHAFTGDKPRAGKGNCEINVAMEQIGGAFTLTVADNGVGLPADLDWEKSETLGLRLIKMLSQQINGSIELDRSAGTTFRLRFAKPSHSS